MSERRMAAPLGVRPLPTGASTVSAVREQLSAIFAAAGIPDAAGEARDLIAAVLDRPRFWPIAHAGDVLDADTIAQLRQATGRRASGMPFAYAVGRAAFRHLVLAVDERVLIPRQETEQLVELVLDAVPASGGVAVDIGTGSGAIALALASEGRFERVIATDVSRAALDVARTNIQRLRTELRCPVELRPGSLLAPVADVRARVLVSNPPYIAYAEAQELPVAVRDWEPPIALFSGAAGMGATLAIVREAPALLESGGLLALELDARRASLAAEAAAADPRYADVAIRLDLAGRERILIATRT